VLELLKIGTCPYPDPKLAIKAYAKKEGEALHILFDSGTHLNVGLVSCYVGLARSVFEHALDYAKKRASRGKRIIRHQVIALMLADMQIECKPSFTINSTLLKAHVLNGHHKGF
jgi:hypothetical protein